MADTRRRLNYVLRSIRKTFSGRSLWACALSMFLAGTILYISVQMKAVYIRDGETMNFSYTFKNEPHKILNDSGIAIMGFDVVDFSGFEGKMGIISIQRAFPITLQVDGKTQKMMTTETTVEDFLEKQQIKLGEYDLINIYPKLYLSPNDHIIIERIRVNKSVVIEEIPYPIEYKENGLLKPGQTRVLSPGKPGQRELVYHERIIDGALSEKELVEDNILSQPVAQLVLRGANQPVSDLDFGIPLDANGVPVAYKAMLPNQICTGYSAKSGAYGASRMKLYDGYVAVRANEIPYGTKMYITSADNSFVYGYAIAADTGTGLMQNIIDIDLFYETYLESCLNGRKYLNVYILE